MEEERPDRPSSSCGRSTQHPRSTFRCNVAPRPSTSSVTPWVSPPSASSQCEGGGSSGGHSQNGSVDRGSMTGPNPMW